MTKEKLSTIALRVIENLGVNGSGKYEAIVIGAALEEVTKQAEPVGRLSVFPSDEATFGSEYNIIANGLQYAALSKMDGVSLFTHPSPDDVAALKA